MKKKAINYLLNTSLAVLHFQLLANSTHDALTKDKPSPNSLAEVTQGEDESDIVYANLDKNKEQFSFFNKYVISPFLLSTGLANIDDHKNYVKMLEEDNIRRIKWLDFIDNPIFSSKFGDFWVFEDTTNPVKVKLTAKEILSRQDPFKYGFLHFNKFEVHFFTNKEKSFWKKLEKNYRGKKLHQELDEDTLEDFKHVLQDALRKNSGKNFKRMVRNNFLLAVGLPIGASALYFYGYHLHPHVIRIAKKLTIKKDVITDASLKDQR